MSSKYLYFVEGECEKKFLKSFMYRDDYEFEPGKVEVFNFINSKMSKPQARAIRKGTKIVIVFDIDVKNISILDENVKLLNEVAEVPDKDLIFVPSIKTFEDELIYSCEKLNNINEMFKTQGLSEFKRNFIKCNNIVSKLNTLKFDFDLMWSRDPYEPFNKYKNGSKTIKHLYSKVKQHESKL